MNKGTTRSGSPRVRDEALNRFLEFAKTRFQERKQDSGTMATPESKIAIHLVNSDIVTIKADACVISVHRTKSLKDGELSHHLLKHAGSAIQKDLNKTNNKQELDNGQVVATPPHELSGKYKLILFVALFKWMEGNDEVLENAIKECLQMANERGYQSVVFPPLGMRGLGYPPFAVAMATMKAINEFNMSLFDGLLKTVYISLYNDDVNSIRTFLQGTIAYTTGRENIILRGVQMFKGLENEKPAAAEPAK